MSERIKGIIHVCLMLSAAMLLDTFLSVSPLRFDLTEDGKNTLSDTTTSLLRRATETIEIHAFFPSEMPAPYHRLPRSIRDLLGDYQSASPSKIRIRQYDTSFSELTKSEQAAIVQKAEGLGIETSQLDIIERDKQVRRPVILGFAILYGQRQGVTPTVHRPSDLEYALTSTMRTLIDEQTKRPSIGFAVGHGEPDFMSSPVNKLLAAIAEPRSVLLDGRPLPRDLNTLIIVGPRRPFNDRCIYLLEQFLMRGGHLIVMLDYRTAIPQFPSVLVPLHYRLSKIFGQAGFEVDHKKTLLDRRNHGLAPTRNNQTGTIVPVQHPGFVEVVTTESLHPLTQGIKTLITPFASPVAVKKAPKNFEQTILMRSQETSVSHPNVRDISANAYLEPTPRDAEESGPHPVAVVARGLFESSFNEDEIPVNPVRKNPLLNDGTDLERPHLNAAQSPGQLLLVSSGARFLGAHPDALVFLQNAVDWFVTDDSLAALRARTLSAPKLTTMNATERSMVRWGLVFGPALALIFIGIIRYWTGRRFKCTDV